MGGADWGAWLLVSLTLTLVLTPAMEADHSSAVSSLDASPEVEPLTTGKSSVNAAAHSIGPGGYAQVRGYVHKDKNTMQVMYLDVAECRSHCDAGASLPMKVGNK